MIVILTNLKENYNLTYFCEFETHLLENFILNFHVSPRPRIYTKGFVRERPHWAISNTPRGIVSGIKVFLK